MSDARTVTVLLRAWRDGDRGALDELIPRVYDELHRLAGVFLRGERPGHTFRATDLVSEAYLRLSGGSPPDWNDRVHFFAVAARHMRQVLVDHARRTHADKRGGGERPVTLDETTVAEGRPDEVIALDDGLRALSEIDERKARVVELHYFGGMTQQEIAAALGVHVATVARDLKVAEAWLHRWLKEGA